MNLVREALKNLPGHWYKGAYTDGEGNYCSMGHFNETYTKNRKFFNTDDFANGYWTLNEVTREQFSDRIGNGGIINLNDHPDTTEDEIIAVFEKAAVRLDEAS